jgi:DNA-binding IclR family transcriptional regulator
MAVIAPDGTRKKQKTRAPARPSSVSETRYAVPALDKGLDVLELLAREPGGLTLNEVARALGRTSSELFRMVTALARRGYIEQGDGDRYTLTLKLFELAHRHKPIRSLTAAAAPLMLELVHRALQSCHLTVFHAGRVMVVGEVDSPERYAFGMKVGALVGSRTRRRATCCLRFRTRQASRDARIAPGGRRRARCRYRSARENRARRREKGYAEVQSRQTRGVTNIAFPIRGRTGHAVAVLNIPYIERIDKKVTPSIRPSRR